MAKEVEETMEVEHRTRSELVREALRTYLSVRRFPEETPTPAELRAIRRGEAAYRRGDHITLREPLGDLKVIPDFLPRPEDLVLRDEGIKVTISLSKRSVEFFKGEARKYNTQYQRMIRRLLDAYAEHHAGPLTRRVSRRANSARR